MSKEDAAGPLKFLRYPVTDTALKEQLGLDKESGHRLPKPRRKSERRRSRAVPSGSGD